MANLSEEERKILEQARQIQDRLEAERLEAGEIDLESENRKRKRREEQRREEQRREQQRLQNEMEMEKRRQQELKRRRQAEQNQRRQAMEKNMQTSDGVYRQSSPTPNQTGSEQVPGQTIDLGKMNSVSQENAHMHNQEYWEAAKREVAAGDEQRKRMTREAAAMYRPRTAASARNDRRNAAQMERPMTRRRVDDASSTSRKKKKKHKAMKRVITILITICIVIGILFGGAYFIVRAIVSKTNYQPYETEYVRADDVMHDPDVLNVLLIGSDERGSVDTARSDAMIVLSINEKTKKIVMTSILRDCYVEIPGYGMQRINHSYQMGGEALLIQTIEQNFKIGIDYYASVDFFSFMEIIDCVDGVDITVEEEEVQWVNAYVAELNNILGDPEGDQYISGAGPMTLTGKQALAYSRIRYVGTDFARTERQRTVLNALIEKLKKANPIQVFRVVNTVLPDVSTNMDDHAMTMTLFHALSYLNYDIEEFRVPMDGTWWNEDANGQEVLGMDFAANIAGLQNTIYGE